MENVPNDLFGEASVKILEELNHQNQEIPDEFQKELRKNYHRNLTSIFNLELQ